MDAASWAAPSGVSASEALGSGLVSIVSLSAMFFIFPFENISVSSFSPDDRKWESGAMVKAAVSAAEAAAEVAAGAAAAKTAASGVDSFSRVTGQSVASSAASSFISLLLCFSVTVFCFH